MPIIPKASLNGYQVGKVHTEHAVRCPAVDQPCVRGIASVRHPDRREVSSTLIGRIFVGRKFEFGAISATGSLQQSPISFVLEFWKIGDCRLCVGDCRGLVCVDIGSDDLIDAIPTFHGFPRRSRVFGIRDNAYR